MAKESGEKLPLKLTRSSSDRMIAGVAGGIADYLTIDPTLIRLIFVFLTFFGGSGIIIYLILWVIMPLSSHENQTSTKENPNYSQHLAQELHFAIRQNRNRSTWGLLIIIIGVLFLFSNFGLFDFNLVGKLWPLFLIILGLLFFSKR